MIVLGIDTSTWWASVGVVDDTRVLAAAVERANGSHTLGLLPLVQRTLAAATVAVRDVAAVAVTRGPGAFTGLRVGLSTAKGLAYATGARLVAVPTLEALARTVEDYDGPVVPLLDARRGEFYCARFEVGRDGSCERVADDRLASLDEVLAGLPPQCVIVGDAEVTYGAALRAHVGPGVDVRPFAAGAGTGVVVARLGEERLRRGESDEIMFVEPDYQRLSEAEMNAVSA